MHIHILGICGTFMGSMALIARDLGHTVTGSDTAIYPPMSTQLANAGIEIMEGYKAEHLDPAPDLVVVGNACKRGMEAVEYMLNERLPYTSGPEFLYDIVLKDRHVLAVAGTHGKTTTTTMLAWILQYAGIDTGFLIGGVPLVNTDDARLQAAFAHSSHLGEKYFVIEADEYDSAFFDKRSKFVHYRPTTAILNNLEYDHADIFPDLAAIQTQFHHMIRTISANGQIIMPNHTPSLEATLEKGVWTPVWRTSVGTSSDADSENTDWYAQLQSADGSVFHVKHITDDGTQTGAVTWQMSGVHNVNNALVAIAAAVSVGVSVEKACEALSNFAGIKRRMELIGDVNDILVFDDFAHHPTAITTTLDGAKKKLVGRRIWAVIEPRSNTMKLGSHKASLAPSASLADFVLWYEPSNLTWGLAEAIGNAANQSVLGSVEAILDHLKTHAQAGDAIIIMSNGGFEGIHGRLVDVLQS
ncbi:UDP-N-acetylmuramate:L-alanyl-gamma-D-glutamyl-meso-diaminopimelate ligase [Moraxella caviae]|uniref:UDP-N-acetylmuramate--L-alanyl-gamma-D-glutamyl-meso-2,6-diaminoheptandioate ligase n=1 Tax=Moraxella caviae TaxID=34060 RepID=A0A1T0AC39_9GAMM|nr:UDP-N-acetylmuramate:L-alanyl-gamma-D-glutamyl-meso-diaminopimelate ligase [Moraxella caviae]OOR93199.1 UDP-N-acetylmuramate:L-alanyl-gamma-D-glutamyl-meso-diaminopimelate ligase [Moraxella caviae]STZ10471.1 UDP-N-acetylmuramate:L-alanyl-gamma-D-glutamyl-meso-diaminopimelate ligase [Moraxella caviae]VEW12795.1 UDP-N-acetylmuramate:L-alanyl-gamma-D-glutamyl-meso-diaminopimelate ligase [Moraxella caviae]